MLRHERSARRPTTRDSAVYFLARFLSAFLYVDTPSLIAAFELLVVVSLWLLPSLSFTCQTSLPELVVFVTDAPFGLERASWLLDLVIAPL